MAKEIILAPGRTFQEFSLLPGLTKKDCTITNISLETKLAKNLVLGIPLLSAAMTSVTGYEMALALGKERGLGVLPVKLGIKKQAEIVRRIKHYEMSFVHEPVSVRETETIDEVLRKVEKQGHSKVPVVDRNNTFQGVFSYYDYLTSSVSRHSPVTQSMSTLKEGEVPYIIKKDLTVDEAKKILDKKNAKYLVVLDEQKRLVKLAFKKDEEKIKIGVAISTHDDWKKRVHATLDEGADMISIDTSDAHSEYTSEVIKKYNSMKTGKPICAGNIVTYDAAMYLMEAGADILKVGMSSGSICTTKREKSVGRAPLTALIEVDRARRDYFEKTKRYVPIISDGGITNAADMIIALTIADAVMLGGYFNKFYEAAGEKLDWKGKITTDESAMREVATWGEGSLRAQNLDRYGHTSKHTFFAEGIEGTVPYAGRLKPALKIDLMKIRGALVNSGCYNLQQLRDEGVIELGSAPTQSIIGDAHSVRTKG